jgi:para-nitrobenzyl esterase
MFTRRSVIASAAALGLARSNRAEASALPAETCIAEVTEGRLRGVRAGGVDVYRGIPYGGSVSGSNRFRQAPPPVRWAGIRDATRLGPPSIQPPGGYYGIGEPAPDEDCLVLNIWTPLGGAARKPVMVYSHGGGFVTGSAGSPTQDGTNLARDHDVVVVATNHRLGLLGFLYLDELDRDYAGSGNRGIQDIALALKWLGANIGAFRGDPARVMIFGDSGGGLKTSCLYAMPAAAPYFSKASIESGPGVRIGEPEAAAETTRRLLRHLDIAPVNWRRLLEAPASVLLDAQTKIGTPPNRTPLNWGGRAGLGVTPVGNFGPVRDSLLLPQHPFDPVPPAFSRDKPLMVGGNEDEQMFFSLVAGDREAWDLDSAGLSARMEKSFAADAQSVIEVYRRGGPAASPSDLYFAIQSDLFSGQGSTVIAERKARQGGAPVFRYVLAFDQGGPLPGTSHRIGAMHALDIAFKFNNVDTAVGGRPALAGPRPERVEMGRTMSTAWASFAHRGKPAAPGLPHWRPYDVRSRATMFLDARSHLVLDPHREEREFWERRS